MRCPTIIMLTIIINAYMFLLSQIDTGRWVVNLCYVIKHDYVDKTNIKTLTVIPSKIDYMSMLKIFNSCLLI